MFKLKDVKPRLMNCFSCQHKHIPLKLPMFNIRHDYISRKQYLPHL